MLLTCLGVYVMGFMTGRASGVVFTLSKLGNGKVEPQKQPGPEEMAALMKMANNQGVMRQ